MHLLLKSKIVHLPVLCGCRGRKNFSEFRRCFERKETCWKFSVLRKTDKSEVNVHTHTHTYIYINRDA
jgi:hypothetical protein